MKKQLTANGNSWLLYINKHLAELMGLKEGHSSVFYTFSIDKLVIRRADRVADTDSGVVKKLIKRSGGYGLNLSLTLLELLDMNPETDQVEIILDGDTMTIKKAK